MKKILSLFLVLFPWRIRRFLLIKIFKYDIDKSAYIGFSWICPKYLKMDKGAKISHFVVGINLDRIVMGENSSIGRNCWITGFLTGTSSRHFSHDFSRKSELIIGNNSSITKHHHIDCTNSIHLGNYVTIAGYKSQLLTHSIDVYENRQDSHSIYIGDYCFVSTRVIILGGASLPSHSLLAAGAVLNKAYIDEWKVYGGIPAKPIKDIPYDAKYFSRISGFVY